MMLYIKFNIWLSNYTDLSALLAAYLVDLQAAEAMQAMLYQQSSTSSTNQAGSRTEFFTDRLDSNFVASILMKNSIIYFPTVYSTKLNSVGYVLRCIQLCKNVWCTVCRVCVCVLCLSCVFSFLSMDHSE